MKRISLKLLATVAFVLLTAVLVSSQGFAADQNWQGLYVGAHFGYGWGNGDATVSSLPAGNPGGILTETLSPDPSGVLGGLQAGYNYQSGIFVIGAETDFSFSDMRGTEPGQVFATSGVLVPGYNIMTHQQTDWLGSLRLRAGVTPVSKLLLYATGGLAYGQVKYTGNLNQLGMIQYPASTTKTKAGWTAGAGAEYALTRNWSVKAEYLYYDLGKETIIGNPIPANPPWQIVYDFKTSANIVRAGINYKF